MKTAYETLKDLHTELVSIRNNCFDYARKNQDDINICSENLNMAIGVQKCVTIITKKMLSILREEGEEID